MKPISAIYDPYLGIESGRHPLRTSPRRSYLAGGQSLLAGDEAAPRLAHGSRRSRADPGSARHPASKATATAILAGRHDGGTREVAGPPRRSGGAAISPRWAAPRRDDRATGRCAIAARSADRSPNNEPGFGTIRPAVLALKRHHRHQQSARSPRDDFLQGALFETAPPAADELITSVSFPGAEEGGLHEVSAIPRRASRSSACFVAPGGFGHTRRGPPAAGNARRLPAPRRWRMRSRGTGRLKRSRRSRSPWARCNPTCTASAELPRAAPRET